MISCTIPSIWPAEDVSRLRRLAIVSNLTGVKHELGCIISLLRSLCTTHLQPPPPVTQCRLLKLYDYTFEEDSSSLTSLDSWHSPAMAQIKLLLAVIVLRDRVIVCRVAVLGCL